jgi:hypothetical protein
MSVRFWRKLLEMSSNLVCHRFFEIFELLAGAQLSHIQPVHQVEALRNQELRKLIFWTYVTCNAVANLKSRLFPHHSISASILPA